MEASDFLLSGHDGAGGGGGVGGGTREGLPSVYWVQSLSGVHGL